MVAMRRELLWERPARQPAVLDPFCRRASCPLDKFFRRRKIVWGHLEWAKHRREMQLDGFGD